MDVDGDGAVGRERAFHLEDRHHLVARDRVNEEAIVDRVGRVDRARIIYVLVAVLVGPDVLLVRVVDGSREGQPGGEGTSTAETWRLNALKSSRVVHPAVESVKARENDIAVLSNAIPS